MRITCDGDELRVHLDVFLVQCVELVDASSVQDFELEGGGSGKLDICFLEKMKPTK